MKYAIASVSIALLCTVLAGCETPPPAPSVVEITERPAEKALLAGIRAYEDAQYAESERQLGQALQFGLTAARDKASAHKHLAFIFCSTRRLAECEQSFRAALKADPGFSLSKSEAGHPLWGPVYQRLRP